MDIIDKGMVFTLTHIDDSIKHGEWDKHKYIAKIPIKNNKFRYIYDVKKPQTHKNSTKEAKPVEVNGIPGLIKDPIKSSIVDSQKVFYEGVKDVKSFSELNKKEGTWNFMTDVATINDGRFGTHEAYTINCSYCSVAYDMRCRGYDVIADAKIGWDYPTIMSEISSWYDNATIQCGSQDDASWYNDLGASTNVNNACQEINSLINSSFSDMWPSEIQDTFEKAEKILEEELLQYGEGARGVLAVSWTLGGGHAMAWEIIDNNLVILDGQTNDIYVTISGFGNFNDKYNIGKTENSFGLVTDILYEIKDIEYFRTDNLEPNEDILRVIKNREKVK